MQEVCGTSDSVKPRGYVAAGRDTQGHARRARSGRAGDTSVDHLLYENAERRPLNAPSSHLDARLADLDQLTDDERATITNVIDALVTKAKLRLLTSGAS